MAFIVNTNIENHGNGYLIDSKNVKGSYIVTASITERDKLPAATIIKGSLCFCQEDSKFYQYNGSSWSEANLGGSASGGTATIDLPIQKGDTENSLEIFDNSKAALEGIAGSSNANLINLEDPEASGVSSVAAGGSAKALVAGGQALGILNTVGAKGYYWHTLDVANKTVTLSTSRPSLTNSACNAPTNIDWAEDDIVVMVNDHQYVGLVIESVTGNTVKFSGTLPFSKDNYKGTYTTYPAASSYGPDDRTIVAFYQTSEAGGKVTRWKCRSGSVELGWAGTAFGIANTTVGASSIAAGFNNIQGGDFGIVAGRNNISGYSNIVVGGWNKSVGIHSAVFGRRNTNEGYYNMIGGGLDNKICVGDATGTVNSYNMMAGQGNVLKRGHRNFIIGSCNGVAKDSAGNITSEELLDLVNNSIISGELHSVTGGNNHIIAGKQNTITKRANGDNSNACAVFGLNNTNNGNEYLLIAGRGLTATNDTQCVIGKFNATDLTTLNTSTTMPTSNELTNPALIIGGGSSASATATSCAIGLNGNIRTVGHISAAGSIKTSNAITAGVSIKTDGYIRAEKYIEAKELVKSLANVQANADVIALNDVTASKNVTAKQNVIATKDITAGYNVAAGSGHSLAGTTVSGNAVFGMENTIGDANAPKAIYGTFMSGKGLKVTGHWQTIIGQYNKYIEKTAFVIGNGSSDTARKNAFSVTTEGNVTAAGKITVGADPTANMDVVTKQYLENKLMTGTW